MAERNITAEMNETSFLAEKYARLGYEQLSGTAVQKAKECILDYLGCTYAGYEFESSRLVRRFGQKTYAEGPCTIIGGKNSLNAAGACFVNSSTGHGPELDDLHKEGGVHAGVVVIPVALALAEALHLSGRDLLAATVLGYDVAVKVGKAANPKIQLGKGFHPTATCGVFGAASTAARLMSLDSIGMANALGIAGSFASGSLECYGDGSLTKRINPGIAAASGVMAADLAAAGYTGPRRILEGSRGFLRAYSGEGCRVEELTRSDGFEIEGICLKSHACCGFNQAPIDAMLKMRSEHGINHENVTSIAIELSELGYFTVGQPPEVRRNPKNEVDAQFSAPFSVAIACIEGKALLNEYSRTAVGRADVHRLMEKMTVRHSPHLDARGPDVLPARVSVTMKGGVEYAEEVWYAKGDKSNPLSWEEVVDKFRSLVPASLANGIKLDRIVETVFRLDQFADMNELARLLES